MMTDVPPAPTVIGEFAVPSPQLTEPVNVSSRPGSAMLIVRVNVAPSLTVSGSDGFADRTGGTLVTVMDVLWLADPVGNTPSARELARSATGLPPVWL